MLTPLVHLNLPAHATSTSFISLACIYLVTILKLLIFFLLVCSPSSLLSFFNSLLIFLSFTLKRVFFLVFGIVFMKYLGVVRPVVLTYIKDIVVYLY